MVIVIGQYGFIVSKGAILGEDATGGTRSKIKAAPGVTRLPIPRNIPKRLLESSHYRSLTYAKALIEFLNTKQNFASGGTRRR
jgi:hypothetical protein